MAQQLSSQHDVTVYARFNRSMPHHAEESSVCYRTIMCLPAQIWQRLEKISARTGAQSQPIFASPAYYFEYALQVALDLRRRGCDIVHIMNLSQYVPLIRAFNPRVKIVLHMHCQWLDQLDRDLIAKRLQQVDLIVGVSEHITGRVRARFPHLSPRCRTVFNGVDVEPHLPETVEETNRTGSSHGGRRVLYVGRISPEKGLHILLDAFSQVVERCPDAHLDILGPVGILPLEYLVGLSDDPRVRDLARFYPNGNGNGDSPSYFSVLLSQITGKLSDRVHLIGFKPHAELKNYYHQSHICVNASFSEAFGLPIAEAMGCGVPAVASCVGGLPEIVRDGETGFLVEPGDTDGLAQAMLVLIANEPLRQSMAKTAYHQAVKTFSWQAIASRLENEYTRLEGQR